MSDTAARKKPKIVRSLKDAALQFVQSTQQSDGKPKFDRGHGKTKPIERTDFDKDNGVAQYPGPNIPHIGNGRGGPR